MDDEKTQQSTNEDYILKIIKKYDKREREREKRWDNDDDEDKQQTHQSTIF